MKRIIINSILLLLLHITVCAQETSSYSLQQSIDIALANNISVKQNGLLAEAAGVNLKQAKTNIFPDLNASLEHGMNKGRSIDPFSNTYVNQSVNYAGYGLNMGLVLFNGMTLQNNIRQQSFAYDASKMEWQQAKDNLVLLVMFAYLQILNNEDLLTSAGVQKELSAKQLERLQILDSQGAISPAQLADVKGQLMSDELNILDIKNNLETSKLALAQLMNVPYNKMMKLERMNTDEFLTAYKNSSDEIYQTALKEFALIKSVELRKRSAEYALKSAKGARYPSLVLGSNLQTNYSSIAQNSTGKIPYSEQIGNNVFSTVSLGLRIPLFNAYRAKYNIRLAGINVRNTKLQEENTKLQLRHQIEQAYLNMTNAFERYTALLEQVAAYNISFKAAEARFAAGVGTSVDYLIAKNNSDRANISLIGSKYDFVLRKKVLDYYQNAMDVK